MKRKTKKLLLEIATFLAVGIGFIVIIISSLILTAELALVILGTV